MSLRKISASIVACLILILLIPAIVNVGALADTGKPVNKAIIVQPGVEVSVTDIASGPPPQAAEATGLDAAGGKDLVHNDGTVRADAGADTTASSKGARAAARSVGINGGGAKNSILNNGTLSSKATSTVTSLSLFVNIDGFTLPFMRKFPPVTGGSLAESFAAGILGGNGNDILEHSGVMTVEATATAAAGSLNVNLTGKDEKVFSKAVPAVWAVKPPVMKADSPGKSVSEAVGIDGGSGADRILSTGPMTVKASAASAAGSLNLNLGNDARTNLSAEATAAATGIRANEGNDEIINQGSIQVEASATAGAGAVAATYPTDRGIYGLPVNPPAGSKVQIPFFKVEEDLSGKATATAFGLSGDSGDDRIHNIAPVEVKASATTGAGSISVGVGTGTEGNVSAEAVARAAGIRGGEGNDTIRNEGTLTVEATSIAGAGSIGVGVSSGDKGGSAKAKTDASGKATTHSAGISGGSGDDAIVNIAPASVKATSTVGAGSVSVGVGMGAEAKVSAESIARAAGIRGGEGNDTIRNEGTLTVEATSIAGAGSIAVGVAESDEGSSADVKTDAAEGESTAKADASAKATATALGISGGQGDDAIVNIAPASVKATSTVGAGSVSVGVGMGAEANVTAESIARAAGIRGGEGNDTIRNEGTLTVEATSIAGAGSIGVGVSGGDEGSSADAKAVAEGKATTAKADASAKATASAFGISGGQGDDAIVNIAPASVKATSTVGAGSVSVGVGMGAEANVSAESIARAAGIRGGEGNDSIRNEGTLTVAASAIAGAGSIAVAVAGSDDQEKQAENPSASTASEASEASSAKADASAKATATALGIAGGAGHDAIVNIAPVDVTASAITGAGSISVGVGTGAEADVSAESIARAAGIRGGEGNDSIRNEGTLAVKATSIAGAGSIAVGVAESDDQESQAGNPSASTASEESEGSSAKADASAKATATALGIAGGAGHDSIANIAPVDVTASAITGAGSISVGVGMGAEANVSAESIARAAGVRGGEGDDTIRNEGTVTIEANAIAGAGSIAVGVAGSDEDGSADAKADASGKAKATAAGISGGNGDDVMVNVAPLIVRATSTVGAGSVAVSTGGDVEGNVSAEAVAGAAGIRGGSGDDEIVNQGTLAVKAKSVAVAGSIAVGVKGEDSDDQEKPPAPPKLETSTVKADASAASKAMSAGIDGGEGSNRITNTAPMAVTSVATTVAGSIAVNVSGLGGGDDGEKETSGGGQEKPETPALELSSAKTDASAKAEARAAGIRSGAGFDTIASGGDIAVDATSTAVAAGVSVNVAKIDKGLSGSAALADAGAEALSAAIGIDGGDGDNGITNSAAIGAKAAATAVGVGVSVDVGIAEKGATLGAAIADSRTTAESVAAGIRSGTGQDEVVNTGSITPDAGAHATAVSVGLTVTNADKGLAASAALADANATATATARGIETGAGGDVILNTGAIAPKAKAGTTAVGVSVGVGVTKEGVSLGASLAQSNTLSKAVAVGIDSGSGSDRVSNTGQIALDSQSSATAVSVGLSVTYAKQGVGASVAIVDAQSAAEATAGGIEAGDGDDRITNSGAIQGIARADTTSVGVAVGVGIAKQGVAAGVGLSDTSTAAGASAVGIDGGRGEDRIVNEGEIKLGLDSGFGSVADADAVSVTVTVAGASQGLAGAAALSKSSATGAAQTTGVYGGEGNDEIRNAGKIDAGAKADVDSTNVAVGVTVAKEGLAGGAALSDSSALATAAARGIDGAEGDDLIVNTGEIKARSESHADTVSVTAIIAGTKTGLAGGAALSDASALATAAARGIEGAAGADRIFNESLVDTKAEAYADTTNVTVTIAGASTGLAGGAALSDTTSASVADAAGLSGGEGNDGISNKGKIVSGALADADATGVTATLTVAKEGLAAGAALSDTSSSAVSSSRGIDGGSGDDRIYNGAKVESKAEAYADTVSVTATISGTKTGVAGGASLSDSSAQAASTARGIEGGAGRDRIRNDGEIDAKAVSGADTTSVTVTVNGSLTGVAGGAALSDASAASLSDASGISGGDGCDEIANTAKLSAQATSEVDATAVTVTLSVTKEGVAGGAALSDTSSSAVSAARGIDGGAGNDRIWNEGVTEATSNASADTVSVSVQVAGSLYGAAGGAAMSDSSAASLAQSTGILGGAGDDVIVNSSKITARSTGDVHATSVSVTVSGSIGLAAGAAFSDASVDSRAESRGINGGEGSDVIVNTGEVASAAGATGKSTSVSVNVALGAGGGATFSDSSALVSADASGIDGGAGHDRIVNTGPVTANASSDADVSSVSVTVGAAVSAGASFGDASVVSKTAARGIDGGEGSDRIVNEGKITAGAMSRVDADSVSVNVGLGWSSGTASIASETTASGIGGGAGDDRIDNRGEVRVGPAPGLDPWMSRITASTFAFGLGGVAEARTSMLASTRSTGIDGGAGNDRIRNEGLVNVFASSTSETAANSVIVFGPSTGSVEAGAVTEAVGIAGGTGDDSVSNISTMDANSLASMSLDNSSFSFAGTGGAGSTLAAITRATGVSGGDGMDTLRNDGVLSSSATSVLTSRAKASVAFGTSKAGATSGALSEAAGISGGAGDDRIENNGALQATVSSELSLSSSSFSFGGTGTSGATLAAQTFATGISGGDGADFILNRGSITARAGSSMITESKASAAFGTSTGAVTSGGVSQAAGIDGGAGDDRIFNAGALDVGSSSTFGLKASGFTFGGTGDTGGLLAATARSTGISGGDGSDFIRNDGSLSLTATSTLTSQANADVVFGSSGAGSKSGSVTEATGISGGAGNDAIANTAAITANTTASVLLDGSSFSFGGTGDTGGVLTATARSTGISGGDGSDFIRNDGSLSLTATSTLTSQSNADVVFGSSSAGSTSGAVTEAIGISGGAGDDRIENNAAIQVTPSSNLTLSSSTFTFGGTGASGATLAATTSGTGISGGDGADIILNRGDITLRAGSTLATGSSSDAAFGTSSGTVISGGVSQAVGIDGGAGDDRIWNAATLSVESSSTLTLKASGFTFGGTSGAHNALTAESRSVGISGGAGANGIRSEGAVTVTASSSLTAKAGIDAAFGATVTDGITSAVSTATGISGGEKGDSIENLSALTARAESSADIGNSTYVFGGTANAGGLAVTSARAEGIAAADGDNRILNDLGGTIDVKASSTAKQSGSTTVTFGKTASGADVMAVASASGVTGGSGVDRVVNSGTLKVDAYANADGGASAGAFWGSPRAIVNARAEATATGIEAGAGNNVIANAGKLDVKAEAVAYGHSWAEEDAGDLATEEARATAIAASTAWGITTGDGSNFIENNGSITVTATATPTAVAETEDNDVERRNPSGTAWAGGIRTGGGDDRIVIGEKGSLSVRAEATAVFGAVKTIAIGIDAGGGADQIENRGSLSVRADATAVLGVAIASATGIDAGGGDNTVYNYGTLSVTAQPIAILGSSESRATGILTGEGSDTIVNAGKILTTEYNPGILGIPIEGPGTAISAGGGNDRVTLETGSETKGLVDLGSGDDTISFSGSLTVTGNVIGGAGIDTLAFSGDGTLGAPITGFETAIKDGPGTYTLHSLAQVKRLEMNGGTLAVQHSYQMPADGVFQARVNSDGSHGQFSVTGVAGLDGALDVVRGKGVYTNGTKYSILTANTVSGWFTSETLPAPSPLLAFQVAGFSDRVEVETLAKSVTTVATNPAQMRIAQMLDKAMATATGKTAEILGEFQALPAQDFQKAFASLNPSSYDRFRKASLTASQENVRSLHNRMTALRLTRPQYSAAIQAREMANTMSLFKTGPDAGVTPDQAWQLGRLSSAETREGSWMSAFGQRGSLAGAGGSTGYDYRMTGTVIGFDQRHGETFFTGYSSGFNRGEVGFEDRMGQGAVDGASSSVYGSWFAGDTYLESALSFARNRYSNHRSIVVGDLAQSATAEHEGNLFTAYLSGGRYFDVKQWVIEPYASILFNQVDEEGFQESGGGLSLRIHDDRTRSLVSDVGLRVARSYEIPFGRLIPEAGIAWVYDFQLDERRVTASLVDVGGSEFSIPAEQTGRHGARFETGFSWLGNGGFAASLKYTGEFRSGAGDQGLFGYLRYEF